MKATPIFILPLLAILLGLGFYGAWVMEWDNGTGETNPLQDACEIVAAPGYIAALAIFSDSNTPPEDDPSPWSCRWIVAPAGAGFWTISLAFAFVLLRKWRRFALRWFE